MSTTNICFRREIRKKYFLDTPCYLQSCSIDVQKGTSTRGLTYRDVNLNRIHQLFYYMNIFNCLAAVTKVILTVP